MEVMEGPVGDAIDSAITFIGKLVDAVKLLWENVLAPFLKWVADNIFPVIAPILEGIGSLAIDLLAAVADVIKGIFDVLSGLIDFIVGIFTADWKKAWEGVKEIFAGIWKLIFGNVKTVIEDISKLIDGVMKAISKVGEVVGSNLISGPGLRSRSGSSSYSSYTGTSARTAYPTSAYSAIPYQMPRLATGTVVPPRAGEFAAILGDNNREPEVVSPLSTIEQGVENALSRHNFGTGDITIKFSGSLSELVRILKPELDKETSRRGVNLVIGGTGG